MRPIVDNVSPTPMDRDIVQENLECYLGDNARRDWAMDNDLYPFELEFIERHFPRDARVLDLGCGAGRTTLGLESRGFEVEAIDLSRDLVAEAQRRVSRSHVQCMDARTLAFPDRTFDAALFSFNGLDCLYPSVERERVLSEVHRVLKPGGIFYYSGHNGLGQWAPRRGDSLKKIFRRNRDLLLAQRRSFAERTRYLAYPEPNGTQVLFSAPPHVHLRALQNAGFAPIAVYGVRGRSYRVGPHHVDRLIGQPGRLRSAAHLARLALLYPHLHYVAATSS